MLKTERIDLLELCDLCRMLRFLQATRRLCVQEWQMKSSMDCSCTHYGDDLVTMADSVLEAGGGSCVNLIVENNSTEPTHLKKGTVLGAFAEADEVLVPQGLADLTTIISMLYGHEKSGANKDTIIEKSQPAILHKSPMKESERVTRLLQELNLLIFHLTLGQQQQLEGLIQV